MGFFNGIFGTKAPASAAAPAVTNSKPNYGGYGSNGANGLKKNNLTKKTFFPRALPYILNSRNSRVPELSLNQKNGIQKTGFVSAQKNTNSINNIRAKTFEQNFLWRILTKIENSMLFKNKNPEPLYLPDYAELLMNPKCTEEDAIFLYNELIAIFIILIIYYQLILDKTRDYMLDPRSGKIKNPEFLQKLFDKKRFIDAIRTSVIFTITSAAIATGIIFAPVGIAVAAGTGIFAVANTASLTALIGLTAVPFVGGSAAAGLASAVHYSSADKNIIREGHLQSYSLLTLFQLIHKTLFNKKNTIPITNVRSKLKFWGLSESHVDFLFNRSPNDYKNINHDAPIHSMESYYDKSNWNMLEYIKDYLTLTKSTLIAPNERLSIASSSHLDALHEEVLLEHDRKKNAEIYININEALINLKKEATKYNMTMPDYLRNQLKLTDDTASRIIDTAECLDEIDKSNEGQAGGKKQTRRNRKGGKRIYRR